MSADPEIRQLWKTSQEIRKSVIRSLAHAGSGHLGGSLDLADIMAVLYFSIMHHKPDHPDWPERDRLILSIGHVAPVLYASLAHAGYFPEEELLTLRRMGSRLQGHPGKDFGLPGLEISSGSLGQGLGIALGLALSARMDHQHWYTYCILGDGELQEGSVWEAAMSAAHHKVGHLIAIVDRNRCQIDGSTTEVMELEPLADKWEAFGWKVYRCNGHDHGAIRNTLLQAKEFAEQPVVILADTVMGKGVVGIENDYRWHGKAPDQKEASEFIEEIEHQIRHYGFSE